MPYVISIFFPKGGSAKSTTSWALSSYFSQNHSMLAIDLDAQCSLTNALVDKLPDVTSYELLKKEAKLAETIRGTMDSYPANLKLCSGSFKLNNLESETVNDFQRAYLLADAFERAPDFDFIIVDVPPSNGIEAITALVAANSVITPIPTELAA